MRKVPIIVLGCLIASSAIAANKENLANKQSNTGTSVKVQTLPSQNLSSQLSVERWKKTLKEIEDGSGALTTREALSQFAVNKINNAKKEWKNGRTDRGTVDALEAYIVGNYVVNLSGGLDMTEVSAALNDFLNEMLNNDKKITPADIKSVESNFHSARQAMELPARGTVQILDNRKPNVVTLPHGEYEDSSNDSKAEAQARRQQQEKQYNNKMRVDEYNRQVELHNAELRRRQQAEEWERRQRNDERDEKIRAYNSCIQTQTINCEMLLR